MQVDPSPGSRGTPAGLDLGFFDGTRSRGTGGPREYGAGYNGVLFADGLHGSGELGSGFNPAFANELRGFMQAPQQTAQRSAVLAPALGSFQAESPSSGGVYGRPYSGYTGLEDRIYSGMVTPFAIAAAKRARMRALRADAAAGATARRFGTAAYNSGGYGGSGYSGYSSGSYGNYGGVNSYGTGAGTGYGAGSGYGYGSGSLGFGWISNFYDDAYAASFASYPVPAFAGQFRFLGDGASYSTGTSYNNYGGYGSGGYGGW